MLSDKELKKKYKPIFWKEPDKYYATDVLKESGFVRNFCKECKKPFWAKDKNRKVCGDPKCSPDEKFAFIGKTPAKNKLSYIDVWLRFSEMFKKLGYTPIDRYPSVARWNPTMEYTNSSIAAFQPFVISGEVEPPANPLTIPQFCLRFSDIDNVGITMSHFTGFVMIGQHMFVDPKDWDQDKVFRDIKKWLNDGLGLDDDEIIFHEDAWAGGGNLGSCMEFFSRGCEIGNQVYMLYEQTPKGIKELNIKVLDMGMGMERNAWFSQGCSTAYDATFPTVIKRLKDITKVEFDEDLIAKFVPYAGALNIDEVADIDKAWKDVAKKVGTSAKDLKAQIEDIAAIYSIAEHSRTLLFALSDGALPSNVGGGYNLRLLVRRVLSFIDKKEWDIHLNEVCKWHAEYLEPVFPELSKNLNEVSKILEVEKTKYLNTKENSKRIVAQLIKKDITEKILFEQYDSNGIPPVMIKEEAEKLSVKVDVPDDFYARVGERHEKQEQVHATKKEDAVEIGEVQDTEVLYYNDYSKVDFKAKVLKVVDSHVVLDKSAFYPTSGGQLHDLGTLDDEEIVDVFKQGNVIIHKLKSKPSFKEGDEVEGKIDADRRKQLAQMHTAAHIINYAVRKVLGNHINQAGAKKTLEKASLDVTHYQSISDEELIHIENEANGIISKKLNVDSMLIPRGDAEKKFGMSIYQGGAVPGKKLRIIEIPGIDVEACGGTHLNNTSEAEQIKILRANKIQDGVVRIEFVAGSAAQKEEKEEKGLADEAAKLLGVKSEEVPARAKELFDKWKVGRKAAKKGKEFDVKELELISKESFSGDVIKETAKILSTQPEHIIKTIKRFLDELKEFKEKLK